MEPGFDPEQVLTFTVPLPLFKYTIPDDRTDFYERLSEEELQEGAIVLATFLYHAAMRDEKIPRDLTP